MLKNIILPLAVLALYAGTASAHEMIPTYPKLSTVAIDGVYKTTMKMFNKREDVEFYEIGVFDKDFKEIPFVSTYKILKIRYLSHVTFDVYIRKADYEAATYICSKSKLRKASDIRTAISSRICSKFQHQRQNK
jgi:hypothetical protein